MWIPDPLYRVLPYLYILVGLFAVMLPEKLGRVSGVMLVIAATIIINLRRAYRKDS